MSNMNVDTSPSNNYDAPGDLPSLNQSALSSSRGNTNGNGGIMVGKMSSSIGGGGGGGSVNSSTSNNIRSVPSNLSSGTSASQQQLVQIPLQWMRSVPLEIRTVPNRLPAVSLYWNH